MASGIIKRGLVAVIVPMFLSGCISSISVISASSYSYAAYFTPTTYRNSYKVLRQGQGYFSQTPTVGEVPILIIPISFSDYPCESLPGGCLGVKRDIEIAFFGRPEQTTWQSVASFYETSSYGQLQFHGEVTEWYTPTVTAKNLIDGADNSSIIMNVVRPAIDWVRETSIDDLTRYDTDSDGFLDTVYFIYSLPANVDEPIYEDPNRLFWAYTSYDSGTTRNLALPGAFHFGWSSYDFMYKDGYYDRDELGRILRDENDKPVFQPYMDEDDTFAVDAHTFIHEIGHFMGLPDYYTYDSELGDWGSTGAADMMDYNVGDHNGFSKALLGWIKPTVVTDTSTLFIRPLVESGDVIIVPIHYDRTLLDEYLLIEYYRPESLNERDSLYQFAGRYPKTFSTPGIKIYHVDARVGRYAYREGRWQFDNYVESYGFRTDTIYFGLAHSNTASRSGVNQNKLIHLLEADGRNSFRHGSFATNASLFQPGQTFGSNVFPEYRFNRGEEFPFTMNVFSTDADMACVIFNRNEY